jgi:PAS domain S-box-containing protein
MKLNRLKTNESEVNFELLFQDNPAPMFIWDFYLGNLMECNNAALLLYEYGKKEFLSLNIRDIRPEDEVYKINLIIGNESGFSNEINYGHKGNWVHKKKNGQLILVEIKAHLIFYKGIKSCIVVVNDITEAKKTEEALIKSENEYKKLFDAGPLPKWIYEPETLKILQVNDIAVAQYGYSKEEFTNMTLLELRPKEEIPKLHEAIKNRLVDGKNLNSGPFIHLKKNGDQIKVQVSSQSVEYQGKTCRMVSCLDVTKIERQKNLGLLEMELLEKSISEKVNLIVALSSFLLGLEKEFNNMSASILKVENGKVWTLAAPSLAQGFMDGINGEEIGPKAGSCGTAAFIKKRVVVTDISTDPLWEDYKDLAMSFNLHSCWSQPVFNSHNEVIATFACYSPKIQVPSEAEIDILSRSASLLSLILENEQKTKEIKSSNERYSYVNLATKDAIYDWNNLTGIVFWGKGFEKLFGYPVSSQGENISQKDNLIHPADFKKVKSSLTDFFEHVSGENWKERYRLKKSDGEYANVEERAFAVRDEKGKVVRMIGVLSDITKETLEEQQLRLAESVIKNTSDAVIITNAYSDEEDMVKVIYGNEAFTKMTGYALEEIVGKSPLILLGENPNQSDILSLDELILKGSPFETTINFFNKNKEEFWNSLSASPVADENGKISHWIFIQRDVTDSQNELIQKRLLTELGLFFNQSEDLLGTLNQVLNYLVGFGDFSYSETWLLSADKKSLNLIASYPKDHKYDIFIEDDEKIKSFRYGEGLPGTVWKTGKSAIWENIDTRADFIRRDAAQKTNLNKALGIPLKFNKEVIGVLLFGVEKNYTKLKEISTQFEKLETFLGSELRRKQLENQLSSVFNASPDIICIADLEGYFVKINPAAVDLIGYSQEELMSRPYLDFIHPEDLNTFKAEFEKLYNSRKISYFEIRVISKSGKSIWLSWSAIFSQEEGQIYAVAKNISKQKELQELLENATKLSKIGGWEVDLVSQQITWSAMTREIHEMEGDEVPSSMRDAIEFYQPEYHNQISETLKASMKNGTSFQFEYPIITKKGNEKWIRAIGKPEFKDGKCVRLSGSFQDIHTQKMAEINLSKSLQAIEDYKKALDQSFNIILTDLKGYILEVNDNTCLLSGYSKEELIGAHTKINKSGYHPNFFYKEMWKKISKGEIWRGDLKNKTKTGDEYWVDTIIVPLKNTLGNVKQYLAIRIDITEKKKAEEALIHSYKEKESILESIGDAFFNLDENWKITYWNNKSEEIFSIKRSEMVGKNLLEEFSKNLNLDLSQHLINSKTNQLTQHFEQFYPKLNLWFEVSAYPNNKGISVYLKDITEQKKYLEKIKDSNVRFEKVTEATNDAIWDWDSESDTLYWGEGFKTLFGYDVAKRSVTTEDWTKNIHPDDGLKIEESLETALKDKKVYNWKEEYRYKKNDGSYAYVSDRGIIIRNGDGKPIRMVGAMADLTQQRAYEESLRELNENLVKKAQDLEISNSELEQFAYIASHDLQEPLRMVTSFLTLLEKKYADVLDSKAIQYIDYAIDGAARMRQIILDLLEYSRIGKEDSKIQTFKLDDVVNEIKVLQKKLIAEKEAIIYTENLPTIRYLKTPIYQVLNNLINNALKYSRNGIIPEIHILCEELEDEWLISVCDNGIGIEKEYFEKIFVIFQRLHAKKDYSGTGMGLAIVKKIIENLGGKILVESIVGQGSTFKFTIPRISK